MPSGETLVTPNRRTRLLLDVQSPSVARPPHVTRRVGPQISKARTARNTTAGVALQPGDGWTLRPTPGDRAGYISSDYHQAILAAADVNLGAGWEAINTWRAPTELPGMGVSGSVISSTSPAFTKRVAAGADWVATLSADVNAMPQPVELSADIPMDRVLSSKATYPANQGYCLTFRYPSGSPPDTLCRLYFGGPAEGTSPQGTRGGEFCVSLLGSGKALLREFTGTAWVLRMEFQAFEPNLEGNAAAISLRVLPYGQNTIAFSAASADGLAFALPFFRFPVGPVAAPIRRHSTFYRTSPLVSGYYPGRSMTGPGVVRLDVRRDIRSLFQIARLKMPVSGTLVDLPFRIGLPVPAGTQMRLSQAAFGPAGTQLRGTLHNSTTGGQLAGVNGLFLSEAGQQEYFARFEFLPDADRVQTPVLWSYAVKVAGAKGTLAPVQVVGGRIRSVSVTGPDLDPTQDSAHVEIQDEKNDLSILRTRGRMPCHVVIQTDAGALTSVLFQGEVARATSTLRGKTGKVYPSASWHRLDCDLVGMWARLAEGVNLGLHWFADASQGPEGAGAPRDPQNANYLPYRITDVIREILLEPLGFPASQVDIPDLPVRLWVDAGGGTQDFVLLPGASFAELLQKLARDYLGMILLWDCNAGPAGMWRLRFNPSAPYTTLAHFRLAPTAAGRLPSHPNSYPAGETFIEHETLRTHVRSPEANFIRVIGAGGDLPGGAGATQLAQEAYNPVSYDFNGLPTSNPLHEDYLGRAVALIHVDPTLLSLPAVNWVLRRLYAQVAHAQHWVQFRAPLLLITDTADASQTRVRPLRIGDAALVDGVTYLVRSCNPAYEHDGIQMAEYECLRAP